MRILSSEWLRTKRTAVRWLTFLVPVVVSLSAVGYLKLRPDSTQSFAFEGFFSLWTGMIVPVAAGIMAGYTVHQEELAGNFNGFLGSGISRRRLYTGKFLLLLLCMTMCTLIAALVLGVGMNVFVSCGADMKVFMLAALLTAVGTIPLLALHLWISFAWGMSASIGISFGGLLAAVLFGTTSLGTNIWQFIPWTWPVKLGLLPGVSFMKSTEKVSAGAIMSGAAYTGTVVFLAAVLSVCLLLLGGMLWFNCWEGRKGSE